MPEKKSLTGLLLDLAEDGKQSRLHSVTVESVFPASKIRANYSTAQLSKIAKNCEN